MRTPLRPVRLARVTSSATTALLTAAIRNNADWCAAVCRSHGLSGTFGETAWWCPRRTPLYYPDAVTLRPEAVPGDFLSGVDTSPGCAVKDSHARLDLTPHGFTELLAARWIHRAAGPLAPGSPALRPEHVLTADRLSAWQTAWHGGADTPDVFRPALVEDPAVVVSAFHDGEDLAGGAVLYRSAEVVGVSNLFAADGRDVAAVWSATIATAATHFPGLPIVGYEQEDDLQPALDSGYGILGGLRVWLQGRPAG